MSVGGVEISRGNFGRLLEPGLRKIVFDNYKRLPEQFSKVMNVDKSSKAIETDLRMGGFSMWHEKGTLDSTEYESPVAPDFVQYRHKTFSKGFLVEKEMVDDEQYNIIKRYARQLGNKARDTVETKAATVFNDAFTGNVLNYKGEALIGEHKRLDGGTRTNLIGNLVLNEANLEIAHKLTAEQVDENGGKIVMNFDTLVVPRALEIRARKILESTHAPHAGATGKTYAENDKNVFKGAYKLEVLDYLTDPDAWFIMASGEHEINFFWREKLNFKNTTDFDTDIAKFKGRMRFSYGWTSDLGIIGSRGA